MARKKKQEEVPAGTPAMLPEQATLVKLARDVDQATTRKDSAVGEIRELISNAVTKHSVDKTAWALSQRLRRMDDQHLAVTWRQFFHICEALGIEARATAQQEMFSEPEPVNVVPLPIKAARGRPKKEKKEPRKSSYRKLQDGNGEDPVQRAVREHASKIPAPGDDYPAGPAA